jgi:moderate conductance mechanosensitive channel
MEISEILDSFGRTLTHPIFRIFFIILIAIILQLSVRSAIDRVVRRAVRGHKYATKLDEEKRVQTLSNILHTASAVIIWITALFVILWQLEVNIAALMTGAGLVGIIVGFGAQNSIKDFLAGIHVITENQYRVGDIVTLYAEGAERSGVVEEITIRITRIRDLDGVLHTIRNGSVAIVSNLSFGHANVNIDVSVAYGSDIDKVEKVVNEVGEELARDEKWIEHIIEPIQFLRVDEFEDSAIRIKSLGMVQPAEQWAVAGEFRRRLIKAFAENGIEIPFPQLSIHDTDKK